MTKIESIQETLQSTNSYQDIRAFPFGMNIGDNKYYLYKVNEGEILIVDHSGKKVSRCDASIVYENFLQLDSIMGDNFLHFKRSSIRDMNIFNKLNRALRSFQEYDETEFVFNIADQIINKVLFIIRGQSEMKSICLEISEIIKSISKDKMINEHNLNRLIELNTKGNYILYDQAREIYYVKNLIDELILYIKEFSFKGKSSYKTLKLRLIMKKFSSKKIEKGNEMILKEFTPGTYEREELMVKGKYLSQEDINDKLKTEFQETFQKNFITYLIN
ncbi:hypothetical protein [Virgibacillus sp. JSM 102003]|uniref:hypothetical protein n=1 Tax=Virgibacillus sp. JSM 102003 TaxID=1562108 RepID=UPI0035C1082B